MAKTFELLITRMLNDSDNYSRPTADAEPQLDQQVFAERLADAISLLSQPAVAQTEAGNDMTTAEIPASAVGHSPLPWKAEISGDGAYMIIPEKYISERDETGEPLSMYVICSRTGFSHHRAARIAESNANAELIVHAVNSVLSESSPKSGSVPAVAGGGEDGETLNFLLTEVGGRWFSYRCDNRRPPERQEIRQELERIRAAIAATKAKEGNHE